MAGMRFEQQPHQHQEYKASREMTLECRQFLYRQLDRGPKHVKTLMANYAKKHRIELRDPEKRTMHAISFKDAIKEFYQERRIDFIEGYVIPIN